MNCEKRLNQFGKYAFGINLDDTYIYFGMFDKEGNCIKNFVRFIEKTHHGEDILPQIKKLIFEELEERNLKTKDIIGVGIGVPGPVDKLGLVQNAPNLEWKYFNVNEKLSGLLDGIPVIAINDVKANALGEMWIGSGKGLKNYVDIKIGNKGVGSAVVNNGELLLGLNGANGEFGHIPINENENNKCSCGNKGCLEQYVSFDAFINLVKEKIKNKESSLKDQQLTLKNIFDAAEKGDEVAVECCEIYGKYLGKALAIMATINNPSHFIFNFPVQQNGEILMNIIKKYYKKYSHSASKDASIILGRLGDYAGMYGAARLII